MRKFFIILIAAASGFALAARAQVTNVPPTQLETFESQTGTVIVKGAGQVGSMAVGDLNVTVIAKESTDTSTGHKEYGLAVEFTEDNRRVAKLMVDYDELDPLLNGLNYLGKIDFNVTALPTFVAGYVTKSGLRVGAFTSQRRGAIQYFFQDRSRNGERILITSAQLAEFQALIEQSKKNLDNLRAPH